MFIDKLPKPERSTIEQYSVTTAQAILRMAIDRLVEYMTLYQPRDEHTKILIMELEDLMLSIVKERG